MSQTVRIAVLVLVGLVVGAGITIGYQNLQREKFAAVFEPLQRERYFDADAIQEARMTIGLVSGIATGVVKNNTWKRRSIGVWAGFVKGDGFHKGAFIGRDYYGYQYFPDVGPNETRSFSIPVGVFMNHNWSALAEFDPKSDQRRPEWK